MIREADPGVIREIYIPAPPSVNNAFWPSRQGFRKKPGYRLWLQNAALWIRAQKPAPLLEGEITVWVRIERKSQCSDVDNRLKAILDAMVEAGCIADDRYVQRLDVEWDKSEGADGALVRYFPYEPVDTVPHYGS